MTHLISVEISHEILVSEDLLNLQGGQVLRQSQIGSKLAHGVPSPNAEMRHILPSAHTLLRTVARAAGTAVAASEVTWRAQRP